MPKNKMNDCWKRHLAPLKILAARWREDADTFRSIGTRLLREHNSAGHEHLQAGVVFRVCAEELERALDSYPTKRRTKIKTGPALISAAAPKTKPRNLEVLQRHVATQ
jgi:hypothetical protein